MPVFPPPALLSHPLLQPGIAARMADSIEAIQLEESLASSEMRLSHLLTAQEHRGDDETADEAAALDRLIAIAQVRRSRILRALGGGR